MCSHCIHTYQASTWVLSVTKAHRPCCLVWQLTVVSKNPCESSEAGLLLATKQTRQRFVPLCLPKPLKAETPAQMDSQKAWQTWTVWLVQFAERNEGKLATFATTLANASNAQVLCCGVTMAFSDSVTWCKCSEKKKALLWNPLVGWGGSVNQNF